MSLDDTLKQQYPGYAAIAGQVPEIGALLFKHINDLDTSRFLQDLYASQWWKSTPEVGRKWQITQLVDPASANQQTLERSNNIAAAARGLGIDLSIPQVTFLTALSLGQGWDDSELKRQIVRQATTKNLDPGAITATQTALRSVASDYALPVSDKTTLQWSKRINAGTADQAAFEEYARDQAKLMFPHLEKYLDRGVTVKALADPYLQIAGQLLGVDPDQMSLRNPKWVRALQGKDKAGNVVGPMTHLDWQRTVMTDPSYGYDHSENARNSAFSLVDELSKTFGVSA